ncbi:hypothetical protein QVD17_07203 [Tagetes erecta]|uniref:Uncharacterized protein n=1 Tax=Tagetes erecta TaxID=13708 RepID=A0AAD8LIE2_TARER|nr:hypothetical protein QVD17_07203 [Tagetes erecta]
MDTFDISRIDREDKSGFSGVFFLSRKTKPSFSLIFQNSLLLHAHLFHRILFRLLTAITAVCRRGIDGNDGKRVWCFRFAYFVFGCLPPSPPLTVFSNADGGIDKGVWCALLYFTGRKLLILGFRMTIDLHVVVSGLNGRRWLSFLGDGCYDGDWMKPIYWVKSLVDDDDTWV